MLSFLLKYALFGDDIDSFLIMVAFYSEMKSTSLAHIITQYNAILFFHTAV